MAVALTDLRAYRHRRETVREANLRLELGGLTDSIGKALTDAEPHLRRLEIMAHEIGPAAWQSYFAVRKAHQRIAALIGPEDSAA